MRNKSSVPRATKTVASPSGQASSRTSAKANGSGKSRPNSTVRQSSLEPYHDIAASVFTINDTAELEIMFLAAARDGDFAQIEALLRRRNDLTYSIDIRDTETGNTAIIWAAKRGHYKIVELLLKHGADVTLRNYDGQTAIEVGSSVIGQLILDSVSCGGPHRNLLQAAWQGDSVLVQRILSENRVDINCRNPDGLTPLLLVTRDIQLFDRIGDKITKPYNPIDVVTELLAHRADPNVEDEDGRSPLHYVSSSKAPACGKLTEILLQEGADIDKRDRRCFTPIHCAAQSGNVDVVVALLTGGSEANSRGFAGTTPLHISAINGNAQVISKLLSHGADVRLVDDGGLTCVDVAKTKRVKAALKEAWSEVTQAKSSDLSPVKTPSAEGLRRSSQSNSVKTMTQNHTKKTGGEVIFDPLPGPTTESITPRRASTIASIERHLSLAEKAKRSEEQLYKDLASGSMSNRGRMPSSVARSPTAGRKLSPIKTHNPPWRSKRDVKFGPGTKHHDGVINSGLKKSSSDLVKGNTESLALPVTVLGLELDDNLQDNRGNRLPTSRVLSSRIAQQYHQAPAPNVVDVSNLVDELYLRGRSSSKASTLTISDDYDDQMTHPTSTSPPRLTPIRTPSASDRNRGLRIPTTINEGEMGGVGYIVNLDHMHLPSATLSSVKNNSTLYVFPNQHKVLPCTPTCLPHDGTDMRLVDCSQDFSCKGDSPRAATNTMKEGDFNIEETRIRNSDDSGIPEDKNSSKSSSVSSSVSNLSSGSPILPDIEDKTACTGQHDDSSPQNESKSVNNMKQSQSDSSLGKQVENGKGAVKNVDSVKLKQIARDNAVMNQQKSKTKGDHSSSNMPSRGKVVTAENDESAENHSSKTGICNSSKDCAQTGADTSVVNVKTSQANKATQNINRKGELSQKCVPPNVKSSSQNMKSGGIAASHGDDVGKGDNQGTGKEWNSSTNLKSINTRSGKAGSAGSNNRPPVPARPSALPGMSTVDKDEALTPSEVSKVIVEDLESEQLCSNQEYCDKSVNQGSKSDTDKASDSNGTKSKPPSESVNKCRTASNVTKAKLVTSNVARSTTSDRNVSRMRKNDTTISKPKNASHGPISTSRQTNTKTQTSQMGATKSRVVSKQNVPKNNDTTPVRPPRKSQIQKANSVDRSMLAKPARSNHQNEKEAASNDSSDVFVESKTETEQQPTPSSATTANLAVNGMKVEEVDVLTNEGHSPRTRSEISHGATDEDVYKSATAEVCITSKSKPSLVKSSSSEGSPSPGEMPCVNANVKQIQVMPYQEQVAPSQHEGPVIVDIFESLRQERELAEQQQNEDARSREKAAAKQKQVLYPKKTKTPDVRVTSAGGKTKRSLKSASGDKNERQKRQQTRKVKKKKVKKPDKEDLMLTDRVKKMEAKDNSSRFVSGKGWYIQMECNDNEDVHSVHENNGSDDSDDDTTWVQPNYISDDADNDEGDILTTSIHRNDNSLRHSWEKKCIPGQIHGDDSEDDLAQDIFEDVEDVQFNVVFTIGSTSDESPGTTSRDIIDITEEAISAKTPLRSSEANQKPGFQNVTVKGTSDIIMEGHHGIMPQVSEAIAAFSRQVTGLELDEMLEGDGESQMLENKSCNEQESNDAKDSKSYAQCTKTVGSDSMENKSVDIHGGNKLDKNHNSESQESKFNDLPSSKQNKSTNLVQNTVIRHTEGFKAPKVQPSKPDRSKTDDEEISEMINEILKSTPDPSLNLSWKSRSENSSISKTSKGSLKRLALVQSLDDSQNCSFKQIPNDKSKESSAFRPQPIENEEEEIQTLQKLVNTYKNMPLHVERAKDEGQVHDQGTASLPKGKPPVPPKTLNSAKATTSQPLKSPRFIRKHDSIKGAQHKITMFRDTDSVETTSEFGTASLPIDDQDTLVPSDRAETVTSRLGRHNSAGRPASTMTNSSEDVETIQWKRGNLLGKGAFGKVWCGLTNAGELIAVKQIELNIDNMEKAEREYEKIQEEVDLLKTLNHQNIVGYLGTSLEDNIVSIFMQFVPGGSIYNLISRFGALEEEVFCRYTKQILQGVQYLHSNNVIHRDIKGGNIMLMQNGVIKLIDFGCAKRLYLNVTPSLNSGNKEQLLKSMRGTPYWMAPEVVREEGHGTKSDIWSIGCTVFEMATMKPPWANEPPYAAIFAIGNYAKPVPTLPEKFSPDARRFVSACLTRDQRKRPSAADLLSHPFILKRMKKPASFS